MAFTVFDSFAEVYDDFDASDPEDLRDRAMLADAIMMYGCTASRQTSRSTSAASSRR